MTRSMNHRCEPNNFPNPSIYEKMSTVNRLEVEGLFQVVTFNLMKVAAVTLCGQHYEISRNQSVLSAHHLPRYMEINISKID